jgi:uncharacterized membrane protein YgdD (TMEM256/DUF423 family)
VPWRRLAAAGALAAAAAVAAGAFGSHALAGRLDERALELWRTADRYLALGGIGALAIAALARPDGESGSVAGGWCVVAGSGLFAFTLFGLALGAPRWLGAVTPLGGAAMIVGFTLVALAQLRRART